MIIVKLRGGLGNQMFQYAFGLSISQKQKSNLYFDDSFFTSQQPETDLALRRFELAVFKDDIAIADSQMIAGFTNPGLLQKMLGKLNVARKIVYTEASLKINTTVLDTPAPAYFDGYWQSEEYFRNRETQVREAFTFTKTLNQASQDLANQLSGNHNTVSIHVRRGDYVSSARTNQIHGSCSTAYYLNAIKLLKEKVAQPAFYIFSDEPAWVKQTLMPAMENAVLIEHNQEDDSWQDLALMSKCRHHIIANSSFSWWGAWLNADKDKIVVAPKDWFSARDHYFDDTDIVPKSWIKLANG